MSDKTNESRDKEKRKALDSIMAKLEKEMGKGTVMRLGDKPVEEVEVIPTGALNLDVALGIGGIPRGRIVEIFGPESSGKTTLALHIAAEAQKKGGYVAFIDAEHALDVQYAKALGVDTDNLLLSQPDSGEQALQITEQLVRSNALDLVIIDSVAALVPRAEIEGDMQDQSIGLQARLMSKALRKITPVAAKANTTVIFLNQLRQKIGVLYGNPETTSGGIALKFYSSVRLDIRRGEQIKSGDTVIGNKTRVRVIKNKMAPPFKSVEFDLMYGTGISYTSTLLDTALDLGIVSRAGAWYSYGEIRLGQGKDNARIFLDENEDVKNEIEKHVRDSLKKDKGEEKDEEKSPK